MSRSRRIEARILLAALIQNSTAARGEGAEFRSGAAITVIRLSFTTFLPCVGIMLARLKEDTYISAASMAVLNIIIISLANYTSALSRKNRIERYIKSINIICCIGQESNSPLWYCPHFPLSRHVGTNARGIYASMISSRNIAKYNNISYFISCIL